MLKQLDISVLELCIAQKSRQRIFRLASKFNGAFDNINATEQNVHSGVQGQYSATMFGDDHDTNVHTHTPKH